ncbi:uncharacterized protein MELLADRAFT_68960 [Melampsora larici-populina 98AG31]|uniref:Uncharacterized protein n=1 Tax=Melampsora larici-populina (strain 98AG31 / pathotype 3-4-7) TaxID=747676 RepID=F4S8W4_MELLP|nr:uncharacterized protein MELLADRAFT_68960 [Melampsora larici-populina 98AG31]EGF98877.1 hypothetical protein MELLADRAFT_68960 [Melampsora larici-populina 98AG31]
MDTPPLEPPQSASVQSDTPSSDSSQLALRPASEEEPSQLTHLEMAPSNSNSPGLSQIVIPDSEAEHENHIAHITNTIFAKRMSPQEFIIVVSPSGKTLVTQDPQPTQSILVNRSLNMVNYLQSQNLTVYEFILSILDCCNQSLTPNQCSFCGTGTYSCMVICGVFIGLCNLIYPTGNEEHIWREIIQPKMWHMNEYMILMEVLPKDSNE